MGVGGGLAKWLQHYKGVVHQMITVYYDFGGSTKRISYPHTDSNFFFTHDKFFYMIISGWVGHLWTAPKTRIFVYLYFCIFILLYFCMLYFVFVLFAFFIFLYLYIFVPTYLFCTFKLDCQGWKASQKFSKIVMSIAYHGVVVSKDVLLKCKLWTSNINQCFCSQMWQRAVENHENKRH